MKARAWSTSPPARLSSRMPTKFLSLVVRPGERCKISLPGCSALELKQAALAPRRAITERVVLECDLAVKRLVLCSLVPRGPMQATLGTVVTNDPDQAAWLYLTARGPRPLHVIGTLSVDSREERPEAEAAAGAGGRRRRRAGGGRDDGRRRHVGERLGPRRAGGDVGEGGGRRRAARRHRRRRRRPRHRGAAARRRAGARRAERRRLGGLCPLDAVEGRDRGRRAEGQGRRRPRGAPSRGGEEVEAGADAPPDAEPPAARSSNPWKPSPPAERGGGKGGRGRGRGRGAGRGAGGAGDKIFATIF